MKAIDGNDAVASVAYRASEIIAIYPITPASPMAEASDAWSAAGRTNLWGAVPEVVQLQSEGGAAGTLHGALQAGALATTFTASQGLLLMIPDLYRIAGELLPMCMHVAARSVATHALSIFCDHSDVMACRGTGLALLASGSPQEAHDLAAIGHAATLASRVPFLHFFDGFRTSHEIANVSVLDDAVLGSLLDATAIEAHRARALTPDRPSVRGTAHNPDTFFQAREAQNPFHAAVPRVVAEAMERLRRLTGRSYGLFDYAGHPDAERVMVLMGSAAKTARATVEHLAARGERVGVVEVRLYRPFDVAAFVASLPTSVRHIAVLDRTKEPGATGEPLYLDVVAALAQSGRAVRAVGGRYGLSSKDFTPSMVVSVLSHLLDAGAAHGFTVGITDDVSHRSLPARPLPSIEPADVRRILWLGIGADGCVGSAKSTLQILADETEARVQGHFEYDSKKSGTITTSHLRVARSPLPFAYRVDEAHVVVCSALEILERCEVLSRAAPGADVILNVRGGAAEAWHRLPAHARREVGLRGLRLWGIDADALARETGLGRRVGTILQACLFEVAGLLPRDRTGDALLASARESYGALREANARAMQLAPARLARITPGSDVADEPVRDPFAAAPDFVRWVTALLLAGKGDALPVSAFPPDGTWPSGTSRWEKRASAFELPVWHEELCIECNKCVLQCPHAAIRANVASPESMGALPSLPFRSVGEQGQRYTLQVAPDDCTGCGVCVSACPAHDKAHPEIKALEMRPAADSREAYRDRWEAFLRLPPRQRHTVHLDVKGSQLVTPLLEFSGACPGCGETPYLKLLTQLFGDRLVVANATGCSSIFGGNLPTTPWAADADGRGPAWENSLFEDNAEFGLGLLLGTESRKRRARRLLSRLAPRLDAALADAISSAVTGTDEEIDAQRRRVITLRLALAPIDAPEARELEGLAGDLVDKTVWCVGGDGWAYDIGYGGLDHVLASGRKINVLVLDTEVYSNTGGQQSKATPLGAVARFAAAGKRSSNKDLGLLAMTYGNIYVARIALGARDAHAVKALREAETFPGPSLVIAYCPCIAHGYDLKDGLAHQQLAVASGLWPLFRFDPRRREAGEPPLVLDAPEATQPLARLEASEERFHSLELSDPETYRTLLARAEGDAKLRRSLYEHLARWTGR
jgi:pyruvate-ferredoxin/flavodoxin oxidoreductase